MSGLSCAYHLNQAGDSDYLLVERSDEPGGLSRSIKLDGFVFDHTGHLLHLHNAYTKKLIPELLGNNIVENERRAWIYSYGVYTRYPYQANLYGLPKKVIKECLDGLDLAQEHAKRKGDKLSENKQISAQDPLRDPQLPDFKNHRQPQTMHEWMQYTFGDGFGKHFFFPYNEKLWCISSEELTVEWVAPFVPRPSMEEIKEGAYHDQTKQFGYNAKFYYPREGGIQALAFAFAANLPGIRLNTSVKYIDFSRKEARLSTDEAVSYEYLVNTTPLTRFLDMTKDLPQTIIDRRSLLRASSVYDINLGINRPDISENKKHWIYFPEKKYRFYRVGFPMNFSDRTTPPGCSSMYVEIGYRHEEPFDEKQAMDDAVNGLLECNLLRNENEIITRNILRIPIAYVTYDKNRTMVVDGDDGILSWLRSQNIYSIGRFGAWKYSYMEEAILEGLSTAEKILGS